MKKLIIFFLFLSFVLPTQASASVCLNSHLAYPKQQASKKVIKRVLKQKMKPKGEIPVITWGGMLLITLLLILIGGALGFILWLIFKGSWLFWVLMGGITGFSIALSLFIPLFFNPVVLSLQLSTKNRGEFVTRKMQSIFLPS